MVIKFYCIRLDLSLSLSLTHNTRASRLAAAECEMQSAQNNQLSYGPPPRVFYYVVLFFSSVGCCAAAHWRSAGGPAATSSPKPHSLSH
jgi:hypothetical protein